MGKVSKRARQWARSVDRDYLTDYIYRREAFVYRRIGQHWLTEQEAHGLLEHLAGLFSGGRLPRVSLAPSKRNAIGGQFRINKHGAKYLRIRGTGVYRSNVENYGIDSLCRTVKVTYAMVPPFLYQATTILHEFAHYLAWIWWADGAHDERWANVCEALYSWYGKSRKFRGVTYRVSAKREKERSTLPA